MPSRLQLAEAVWVSLSIPLIAFLLALMMVIPLVWGLRKNLAPVRITVSFFRSTPLVSQLFLFYFGLPEFEVIQTSALWHVVGDAYRCAILVFALNGAAHLAHHFRILSIGLDRDLLPAANALHISRVRYWVDLAGPRALAVSQTILRQELIQLFKAGSICSLFAINDFSSLTKAHLTNTFDPFGAYMMALFFYSIGVFAIQSLWSIPRRLKLWK